MNLSESLLHSAPITSLSCKETSHIFQRDSRNESLLHSAPITLQLLLQLSARAFLAKNLLTSPKGTLGITFALSTNFLSAILSLPCDRVLTPLFQRNFPCLCITSARRTILCTTSARMTINAFRCFTTKCTLLPRGGGVTRICGMSGIYGGVWEEKSL